MDRDLKPRAKRPTNQGVSDVTSHCAVNCAATLTFMYAGEMLMRRHMPSCNYCNVNQPGNDASVTVGDKNSTGQSEGEKKCEEDFKCRGPGERDNARNTVLSV